MDITPYVDIVASPDGQYVAGGTMDGTVRLWSVDTGELVRTLPRMEGVRFTSLSFSSTGERLVLSCDDNTFQVWDVDMQKVCVIVLLGCFALSAAAAAACSVCFVSIL